MLGLCVLLVLPSTVPLSGLVVLLGLPAQLAVLGHELGVDLLGVGEVLLPAQGLVDLSNRKNVQCYLISNQGQGFKWQPCSINMDHSRSVAKPNSLDYLPII